MAAGRHPRKRGAYSAAMQLRYCGLQVRRRQFAATVPSDPARETQRSLHMSYFCEQVIFFGLGALGGIDRHDGPEQACKCEGGEY
jgi:hypothetical protein